YVYASPAVTNAPGIGPTIYVGSYDGNFYALNARSGQITWKFNAGGKISGSATIVGRTLYFADLRPRPPHRPRLSTRRLRLPEARRRLRPGHQRRPQHLPDRLHGPVRARAALRSRPPRPQRAAAGAGEAEGARERETGGDGHRGGLGSGYERPAAGCRSHAASPLHEREVAAVVHAHEKRPRRVGVQREGGVAQRGQPSPAAEQPRPPGASLDSP